MNAAQIARALGGHRSGNQWKCRCPAHDDTDPSMIIFDGKHSVQVRCYAGCEPLEIIAALRSRGLWGDDVDGDNSAVNGCENRSLVEARRADPDRHHKLAMKIWEAAQDPAGTAAEHYLRGRGLVLPPKAADVIGFHPRCPNAQLRAPALVALMRNVETFKPQAVQRLFLDLDQNKKTEGMMLGPVGHAAMMITSRHNTFWDCLSFCPMLYICEGLETGLALHQAGYHPVWALGSAGAIARLPVLFAVGHLVICADNDPLIERDGREMVPGLDAAMTCAERWNATTHQRATIIMPPRTGTDYANKLTGV
jgi:putative DNA primase/helicase